jgi:hypothetical protein
MVINFRNRVESVRGGYQLLNGTHKGLTEQAKANENERIKTLRCERCTIGTYCIRSNMRIFHSFSNVALRGAPPFIFPDPRETNMLNE